MEYRNANVPYRLEDDKKHACSEEVLKKNRARHGGRGDGRSSEGDRGVRNSCACYQIASSHSPSSMWTEKCFRPFTNSTA